MNNLNQEPQTNVAPVPLQEMARACCADSARPEKRADIGDIIKDIDYLISPPGTSRQQNFTFCLNSIPYEIRRVEQEHGPLIQIHAVLGYLPYTAESLERRAALLYILSEAQHLLNARFGLDRAGKIIVVGRFADIKIVMPDFIFYPLTKFLQEARPFIDLIGRYL